MCGTCKHTEFLICSCIDGKGVPAQPVKLSELVQIQSKYSLHNILNTMAVACYIVPA